MWQFVKSSWTYVLYVIFPDQCVHCSALLHRNERLLCVSCWFKFPFTHYHSIQENASFLRLKGRVPITFATSFAYFYKEGMLQQLLHRLKYRGDMRVGTMLAEKFMDELDLQAAWLKQVDAVASVPLYYEKEKQRGYNQADVIAKVIAKRLGVPLISALKRVKSTASQTSMTRVERLENISGAFVLNDTVALQEVKHLLLVDDVLTTGATIESCVMQIVQNNPMVNVSVATIGVAMD